MESMNRFKTVKIREENVFFKYCPNALEHVKKGVPNTLQYYRMVHPKTLHQIAQIHYNIHKFIQTQTTSMWKLKLVLNL